MERECGDEGAASRRWSNAHRRRAASSAARHSLRVDHGRVRRRRLVRGHPQRVRLPRPTQRIHPDPDRIGRRTLGAFTQEITGSNPVGVPPESSVSMGFPVAAVVLRGRTPAPMEPLWQRLHAHESDPQGTLGAVRLVVHSHGKRSRPSVISCTERASANGQAVPVRRGDEDDPRRGALRGASQPSSCIRFYPRTTSSATATTTITFVRNEAASMTTTKMPKA